MPKLNLKLSSKLKLVTVLAVMIVFQIHFAEAKLDDQTEKLQPCMQIKKACEGVGFSKIKMKIKDCMQKITNGESVDGVQVSANVVNGCKEKHEK